MAPITADRVCARGPNGTGSAGVDAADRDQRQNPRCGTDSVHAYWVGQVVFARACEDRAEACVISPFRGCLLHCATVPAGGADQQSGRDPTRAGHRQIVLAEVDTVGLGYQSNVEAVVDHDDRTERARYGDHCLGERNEIAVTQALCADLEAQAEVGECRDEAEVVRGIDQAENAG